MNYVQTQMMMAEHVVPRPRGCLPKVCAVLLSSVALVTVWLLDSELMRETSELVVFALSVGAVLHSLCMLTEEWLFHLHQR